MILSEWVCSGDPWSPFSFCQVDLEEERLKKRAAALTLKQKTILYSLRVAMWCLAFLFIIGAFFSIFRATVFSQVNEAKVKNIMQLWSLVWKSWVTFFPPLLQTGKEWAGRDLGFDF